MSSLPNVPRKTLSELRNTPPSSSLYICRLLLKGVEEKVARNGNSYLSIQFSDKTNQLSHICFDDNPSFKAFQQMPQNSVIDAVVSVDKTRDQFSLRFSFFQILNNEDEEIIASVTEMPKESISSLWGELNRFVSSIKSKSLLALCNYILARHGANLQVFPAAHSIHHARKGGLLEHTTNMLRIAYRIHDLYPGIDMDLVIVGILLHDIGKTREYSNDLSHTITLEGHLKGHVPLGLEILEEALRITPLPPQEKLALQHIVGSHMHKPEWGATTYPSTIEAIFVAHVDLMDAKMDIAVSEQERTAAPSIGAFNRGLDTRFSRII